MRLFTTLGPGDIVGAHRAQMAGAAIATETSLIFSGQLVEFCRLRGITLLAIGSNPRRDRIVDGELTLEQGPKPLAGGQGPAYHLGMLLYGAWLAWRAWRFKADVAIIDSGTTHYFVLALMSWAGIPVAVNFHNVLWPQGFKPGGRIVRAIRAADGRFFARHARATLGCSPECGRQASELAGRPVPFFEWRGQFRTEGFPDRRPGAPSRPFRLLFVGRAEESKGVLDLVGIARRLEAKHPGLVEIEVAGDGGALPALREAVEGERLGSVIRIHGRLSRAELLPVYGRSDAVIVPTRGNFCEGLPLVCGEAVISGRPIVTSRLSNALPVLGPAIEEAQPQDLDSYVAAIERLALDPHCYARRQAACAALAGQFFDRAQSYPAAVDRALAAIVPGWTPSPDYGPVFAPLLGAAPASAAVPGSAARSR